MSFLALYLVKKLQKDFSENLITAISEWERNGLDSRLTREKSKAGNFDGRAKVR